MSYTGTETWNGVPDLTSLMDVPPTLSRFVPAWDTLFLNLHRTNPADLTRFSSAVGYALRVLQAEREPLATLEQVLEEALTGLEGLAEEQAGQWVRVAWYLALLVFHRRSSEESPALVQRVQERARASKFHERTEADTIMITLAQEFEARGEAWAAARMVTLAQEAEARGEARATRQALELVLSTRFGTIPLSMEQALAAADLPPLQTWLQRAVQAATSDEAGIS